MRRVRILVVALLAAFCLPLASRGQDPYDPPASYYTSATGSGATLKAQLNDIIDGHTQRSYEAAKSLLPETDEDPNNPNRMILVYNRASHSTVWDNADTWNREHVWPESRGVGSGGPDQSDLHMLRPSLTSINSQRGSYNFGGAFGQSYGVKTDKGATVFYPGDADAGMVARQSFYMAVRYDGADSGTANLVLQAGNPSTATNLMGDLDRMIEWHYTVVPDAFERRRNSIIYQPQYQGNRNPFVDRPEYAWSIFVNQTNDSSIALAGSSPSANGATTLDLNLGRVLVGAPVPAPQPVSVMKSGLNGTYYQVTPSGAATSSVAGKFNAFRTNMTDSKVMNVGLNASTAAAGLKTGAVTIDNLDITTGGGAGRGANDGNDVVNVSLSVLSHANPSFVEASDVNALTYDFGSLTVGAFAPTFSFEIHNLPTVAGFTAGLDLDSVSVTGDGAAFSTTLASFGGSTTLAAGGDYDFTASLNTSVVGSFSTTYVLAFSDENLPGAASLGTMSLTLTGVVQPASADFDADGDVDGADFLTWQRGLGMTPATSAHGDSNGDEIVDALDLDVWRQQMASGAGASLQAVPEPSTSVYAYIAFTVLVAAQSPVARRS